MAERKHGNFGGDWTDEKLERLAKYLPAYTKILKGRAYKYAYIDAFAGPGYRVHQRKQAASVEDLWDDDPDERGQRFTASSALVAMRSEPPFQSYIFIERDESALRKLEQRLREGFRSGSPWPNLSPVMPMLSLSNCAIATGPNIELCYFWTRMEWK